MTFKHYALYAALLLLTACTATKPQNPSDWHVERDWKRFDATGRIGVKIQEKGSYANFDWTRTDGVETISINTPLGNTVGQLCRDAEGVLALDANNHLYQANNAANLSQQLLGYHLPVEHLSVWANGEWVKNVPYTINPDGTLQQYGWHIQRQLNEDGMPHILMLENNTLSIRMVFTDISRETGIPTTQGRCTARTTNLTTNQ